MRTILHVDMDAFFASVEQRDDPGLGGRPVVVGGRSRRGVVAAASYEAREFGVRSAMSMVEALKRCPIAEVVAPRHARYAEVSAEVFAIFRRYTPMVEGLSLDEAFLDVGGSARLFGDGPTLARRIRDEVRGELGLTCSAGVAPNKFVAKIASDVDKPDGLTVVRPEQVSSFLAPLPLERMWGVGPKAAARLRACGFRTIGDLAASRPETLEQLLGSWGREVAALARGEDERPVVSGAQAKSIGAEETFEEDLRSLEALRPRLLAQSARVASRLVKSGLWGRVVQLKIKWADHRVITRQRRLPEPAVDTDTVYRAAVALLERIDGLEQGVRLIGVSVSELTDVAPEVGLFPDADRQKRERLERVTADLKARFGARGAVRGTLLDE